MITLTKSGNAIVFTFDDNDHYLNDGTIEVPVNSLTLVTDESQMATFKRSATNDIFISATYDELGMSKSDLESWFKENACGSTGGGGGGVTSGWVENYVEDALEPYAVASAVTEEISEAVSGKADTSAVTASINAAVSGKMDTSAFNTYSASTDARLSEDEEVTSAALNALDDALDDKADTTAVTASIAAAVSGKQDTLVAGTNITISGNVISAEGGSITVDSALSTTSENPVQNKVITNNTLSGRVEQSDSFRSFRFWNNNGTVAFYKRYAAINGVPVLKEGTTSAPEFNLIETSAITTSVTSASTNSQVPSAKAVYDALQEGGGGGITPEEVEEMIVEAVSGKADSSDVQTLSGKLATDEEVIARALVDLQKVDVIEEVTARGLNQLNSALGGLKLVQLTQAEYNALTTKDASTLYFIVLPPEPQYRWVNDGANTICGDGDEYDSCNLYQRTKKQVSLDSGQTWSDVSPAEYGYGNLIEEDSQECGCGSGCREIDLADELSELYDGELVQGFKFGWIMVSPGTQETVYIWDYNESGYIGKVTCVVDNEDETIKTVYIYDDTDALIETINDYAEWDDWIELCNYFEGSCMKLSTSSSDEDAYPNDGFPIIIKVDDSGENCDCSCFY